MPFGLTNTPAVFQGFINEVLREYLNDFVFVYLDDILIFSPDPATHQHHVRQVLSRLLENKLFVKAEKCEFHASSVSFLGFVVSLNHVKMDPEKNAKPDALSRLYEPKLAAKEPEPILPPDRVVGAVSWQIENDVTATGRKASRQARMRLLQPLPVPQTMVTHFAGLRHGSASSRKTLSQTGVPSSYLGFGMSFVSSLVPPSAYHLVTNGQTERLNQEPETCLRCLVAQNQTTWSNHLTWVEYAHNSLPTAATGLSPFQVVHRYQPPLFPANEEEVTVPSAHALARRCRKIWAAA
ncbi:hypothetical protein L3Q82_017805 [Scortum barcoo]|uniref:Uncharacterized protein n=1 Tax=Scortum barcoo TaxID=214431 RepID=A0ACB8VM98_9TELE|nr:hypothetical protein L3Q82_017805 [Scortum barcoo]